MATYVGLNGPHANKDRLLGKKKKKGALSLFLVYPSFPSPLFEVYSSHFIHDFFSTIGSHTIGLARCTSFRNRIYTETNIDSSFARTRQSNCPRAAGSGDNNLAPLDLQTPTAFNNDYYQNLINRRGLLHSDQQLFNGGSTDSQVRAYYNSPSSFNADFAAAMIKMGDVSPLTGSRGEVRKNCRRVN